MTDSGIDTYVMTGGAGTRLLPLTQHQCAPVLAFGAEHRVIDFVLTNLHNSGPSSIGAGARLRKVIVDGGNAIPRGELMGFDARRDRARFPVTEQGLVVVPARFFPPARQATAPVPQVLSA